MHFRRPSIHCAACGFQVIWAVRHLESTSVAAQRKWLIALFTLSLGANAVATCKFAPDDGTLLNDDFSAALLAFRIWQVERQCRQVVQLGSTSLVSVLRLVLESGALNAAYLLAYVITLVSGSEGLESMSELVSLPTSLLYAFCDMGVRPLL